MSAIIRPTGIRQSVEPVYRTTNPANSRPMPTTAIMVMARYFEMAFTPFYGSRGPFNRVGYWG